MGRRDHGEIDAASTEREVSECFGGGQPRDLGTSADLVWADRVTGTWVGLESGARRAGLARDLR